MRIILFLFLLFLSISCEAENTPTAVPFSTLQLPPGFQIEIYAWPVPGVRQMALGTNGTVFAGSLVNGRVYAITPDSSAVYNTRIYIIASGLTLPNGVAFADGSLYVAATNQILRYDNIEDNLRNPPAPVVIAQLPSNQANSLRFLRFSPDGKLYVSIGMPCNSCTTTDEQYGTISRMDKDGSNFEIFVSGIRNVGGFDWDSNHHLWFSEDGQEFMGDDKPPDKINIAPEKGLNFGFPYYDGKNLPNSNYSPPASLVYTPPTYELPPHVTPLGIVFYTGTMFPKPYRNSLFIAEHGSMSSTYRVGYQVSVMQIKNNIVVYDSPFITGWLQGQQPWGSPVDILLMPDGALLISDDFAGVIYRISYKAKVL